MIGSLPLTGAGTLVLGGMNVVQSRRLRAARRDPLTGLATRQSWTARAERAARHPRGLVVLVVDGDGLKTVNDAHGHQGGDAVIAALARRLQGWTGPRGLAGRVGGDEFTVFLRPDPGTDLAALLTGLCTDLSEPVWYGTAQLRVTASIGAAAVAGLPVPTLFQAMRAADEAMYTAKTAGGGAWRIAGPRTEPHPHDTTPARRTRTRQHADA